MCLILFAFRAHPDYPLVVAANRDEAYARPSLPAAFWQDHPEVYGGRDLDMGGTWLALARGGRFAAITNFRDGFPKGVAPRSRGALAREWLTGGESAPAFFKRAADQSEDYAGYGMIAGDLAAPRLWYLSNRLPEARHGVVQEITPGVHGLSNHLLNTPWPKLTHGRNALSAWLPQASPERAGALLEMLADRTVAPDDALPDTGIGIQREKQLGPKFIAVDDRYGTRASTVILVGRDGSVFYAERSFGGHGRLLGEVTRGFQLTAHAASQRAECLPP
jgi:uncharacterized protein with NRDE domain